MPPPLSVGTPPAVLHKSLSTISTQSRQLSVDDLIDDFEDEEDGDAAPNVVRRQLNDASDLVLDLPAFKTGMLAGIRNQLRLPCLCWLCLV